MASRWATANRRIRSATRSSRAICSAGTSAAACSIAAASSTSGAPGSMSPRRSPWNRSAVSPRARTSSTISAAASWVATSTGLVRRPGIE